MMRSISSSNCLGFIKNIGTHCASARCLRWTNFARTLPPSPKAAKSFREKLEELIEALAAHPAAAPVKTLPLSEAKYAAATALLGGLFIGLVLGKFVL